MADDDKLGKRILTALKRVDKVDRARVEFGRLDYPGADIYLRLGSYLDVIRLGSCAKEPWTVAWIEDSLQEGEVLYDVGANVGAYTLVAAKLGGGRRVVALEPAHSTFSALCENVIANRAHDDVIPLQVALGSATERSELRFDDLRTAASHALTQVPSAKSRPPLFIQPVLTFRLDDLIEQFSLPAPNHLKIDVDGAELGVLRGAGDTLAQPGLRSLLVELHDDQEREARELLAGHGFRLRTTSAAKRAGAADYSEAIFVREARDAGPGAPGA